MEVQVARILLRMPELVAKMEIHRPSIETGTNQGYSGETVMTGNLI